MDSACLHVITLGVYHKISVVMESMIVVITQMKPTVRVIKKVNLCV